LETGELQRLGSTTIHQTNVRLIAATNKDLKKMVSQNLFREDLYYRLHIVPIHLPPLRERPEDVVALAQRFLDEYNKKYALRKTFSAGTIQAFLGYSWPGNVRELKNIIERLVVMAQSSEIRVSDIPEEIKANVNMKSVVKNKVPLIEAKKEFEKHYIVDALNKSDKKVARASILLGIAQKNLYKKIKEYNIKL